MKIPRKVFDSGVSLIKNTFKNCTVDENFLYRMLDETITEKEFRDGMRDFLFEQKTLNASDNLVSILDKYFKKSRAKELSQKEYHEYKKPESKESQGYCPRCNAKCLTEIQSHPSYDYWIFKCDDEKCGHKSGKAYYRQSA